jgi:hypothetical protein
MSKVEATIYIVVGTAIGVAYALWVNANTVYEPLQGVWT